MRRRLLKKLQNESILGLFGTKEELKKYNRNKCPQCKKFDGYKIRGKPHKVCTDCRLYNAGYGKEVDVYRFGEKMPWTHRDKK